MNAAAADVFTLEVDHVLCAAAEDAGQARTFRMIWLALHVDFQGVLDVDVRSYGAAQSAVRYGRVRQPYGQYRWISCDDTLLHFFIHSIASINPCNGSYGGDRLATREGIGVDAYPLIWVAFLALALLCGAVTGRLDAVTDRGRNGRSEKRSRLHHQHRRPDVLLERHHGVDTAHPDWRKSYPAYSCRCCVRCLEKPRQTVKPWRR